MAVLLFSANANILWLLGLIAVFLFLSLWFLPQKFQQTVYNRHTALLQKAQEELEGNTSNKLSLKATLTDQIKEQESTLATVKEVKSMGQFFFP